MPKSKEIISSSESDDESVGEVIEQLGCKPAKVDAKGDRAAARHADSSDADSDEAPPKKKKKSHHKTKAPAAAAAASAKKGHGVKVNGETRFEIGKMKYATATEFKGRKMVNIREFYMAPDGEMKPGKKGIALMMDQWEKLKEYMGEIDDALNSID